MRFAERGGNSEDAWGGGECGVCYKGRNEGMGRVFKKEEHEAPHTSFLDNEAAESFSQGGWRRFAA